MHSDHSIELNNQYRELREGWVFFSLQAVKTGFRFSTPLLSEVCELLSVIIWEYSTASLHGRNKAHKAVPSPLARPHSWASGLLPNVTVSSRGQSFTSERRALQDRVCGNMVLRCSWNRAELCQCIELQRLGHSHLNHLFRSLFLKMLFLVLQLLKHKTSGTG